MYASFVDTFNSALKISRQGDFPATPLVLGSYNAEVDILFHRNNGTNRTPNVVLCPLVSARRANSGDTRDWEEIALNAGEEPPTSFGPVDVLGTQELQFTGDRISDPPNEYTSDMVFEPVQPVLDPYTYVDSVVLERLRKESKIAHEKDDVLSVSGERASVTSGSYRCSHLASGEQTNQQHRADRFSRSDCAGYSDPVLPDTYAFAQRKHNPLAQHNEDCLPPLIQNALYGVQSLSHSPWINHAINMLIIGNAQRKPPLYSLFWR